MIALLTILIYAYFFLGGSFSKETTDWGAFGNYASIGLSIISIALIYITYQEQRDSNRIFRAEQHITTMSNTLIELTEKKQFILMSSYSKLCAHFITPIYDLSYYKYEKIICVLKHYYTNTTEHDDLEAQNRIFQYMYQCIQYILEDNFLRKTDKQSRITELSCIIPEHVKTMFLCWMVTQKRIDTKKFYKYGIFSLDDTSPQPLRDILFYVGTKELPFSKPSPKVSENDIIFENPANEQFHNTYSKFSK